MGVIIYLRLHGSHRLHGSRRLRGIYRLRGCGLGCGRPGADISGSSAACAERFIFLICPSAICADIGCGDGRLRLCRTAIAAELHVILQLLSAMKRTGNADACKNWRKDIPLLLISGNDDPVGNAGKGVIHFENNLRKAGITNIRTKLFPDARHDVLHEEASGAAREARSMIAAWLAENIY